MYMREQLPQKSKPHRKPNSALTGVEDASKAPVQKNFIRAKKKSHAYQEYVHMMETCHLQSNSEISRLLTGIVNNQTSVDKLSKSDATSATPQTAAQDLPPQATGEDASDVDNSYKSVEELDEFTNLLEEYLSSLTTSTPEPNKNNSKNNNNKQQATPCKLDQHSLPDAAQIDSLKSLNNNNFASTQPLPSSVESFKQLADLPPADAYRLRKLHYYKKLFERYKDQRGLQLAYTIHECLQLMQSQLQLGSDEEPLKLASLKPSVENKALISSQQKNNDKFYQDMKLWQSVTAITDLMQCECDALLQSDDMQVQQQ